MIKSKDIAIKKKKIINITIRTVIITSVYLQ